MDKGDTADIFVPGNQRIGIDRREFSYSFHIPERRLGRERRRFAVQKEFHDESEPPVPPRIVC